MHTYIRLVLKSSTPILYVKTNTYYTHKTIATFVSIKKCVRLRKKYAYLKQCVLAGDLLFKSIKPTTTTTEVISVSGDFDAVVAFSIV